MDRGVDPTRQRRTVPHARSPPSRHALCGLARQGRLEERRRRRALAGYAPAAAGRVLGGRERRRWERLRRLRAEHALPQHGWRADLARAGKLAEHPLAPDVELSAAPVDLARALDCSKPARRGTPAGGDQAGWPDVQRRRWADVGRPSSRRTAGRACARLAPTRPRSRLRGRWWWRGLESRRRLDMAT